MHIAQIICTMLTKPLNFMKLESLRVLSSSSSIAL